jgi:hypothetical protein
MPRPILTPDSGYFDAFVFGFLILLLQYLRATLDGENYSIPDPRRKFRLMTDKSSHFLRKLKRIISGQQRDRLRNLTEFDEDLILVEAENTVSILVAVDEVILGRKERRRRIVSLMVLIRSLIIRIDTVQFLTEEFFDDFADTLMLADPDRNVFALEI